MYEQNINYSINRIISNKEVFYDQVSGFFRQDVNRNISQPYLEAKLVGVLSAGHVWCDADTQMYNVEGTGSTSL